MQPTKNENLQPFQEFTEIIQDLHHVENRKEPIFSALFIDGKPHWRRARYSVILKDLNIKFHENPRKAYTHHLSALRKKLTTHRYSQTLAHFSKASKEDQDHVTDVQNEVIQFFTTIDYHKFCKALVHLMQRAGKAPRSSDFISHLQNTRISIENAPHLIRLPIASIILQFLKGQFNFHYDPYMQENTPYRLFDYPHPEKTIPVLRMGTPTFEGFLAPLTETAVVTHEFEGFLEAYRLQNKKHLYINLQNRNPGWHGWNEAPRCKVLEALGKKFPETITVITLAKNTSFYHQVALFAKMDDAAVFKEAFLEQLYHKEGGFYFEQMPTLVASDNIFISLMDKVHETHFQNKTHLNKTERLAFIEFVYLEIEKYCIDTIKPDTLNISCKDGIDRAGGATALLYFDTFLRGKELNDDMISDLEAILFAPALLVKKRPITENRFLRFINAVSHL